MVLNWGQLELYSMQILIINEWGVKKTKIINGGTVEISSVDKT